MPGQRPLVEQLPPERLQRLRAEIRRHDVNLAELRQAFTRLRGALRGGVFFAEPEYRSDLEEIVIGIERAKGEPGHRLLEAHEPILRALPAYTSIVVLVPLGQARRVRTELRALGLGRRARLVVDPAHPDKPATTRWVRDILLVGPQASRTSIATPLRYQPHPDLRWNDLQHVMRLSSPTRRVLATPLFFRAGNLLLGVTPQGRRILFVGEGELRDISLVYDGAVGFRPPQPALIGLLAALGGADAVEVLPNTRSFFHIDMAMSFIADGVAVLVDPLDAERLPAADRTALARLRSTLARHGFRTIAVPSTSERVEAFRSPVNLVPFRHREDGRRMALVPTFPDVRIAGPEGPVWLNAQIEAAYRSAGIEPVAVEDRFHPGGGNTHCAVVALH
jgi:hypothetical protein